MTKPKKTDPLTVEEVTKAADIFFPLYDIVASHMPEDATTGDIIKLSETIFGFAHKLRAVELKQEQAAPFGFNKNTQEASK